MKTIDVCKLIFSFHLTKFFYFELKMESPFIDFSGFPRYIIISMAKRNRFSIYFPGLKMVINFFLLALADSSRGIINGSRDVCIFVFYSEINGKSLVSSSLTK